jgi:hypothetical protein
VLVVPSHSNERNGNVDISKYGYSIKDGNVIDAKGTKYNTIAMAPYTA